MANMFRCTLASGGGALVLTVICDADFAGLTITATDGTTTLTQPCPSSSPYEVEFRLSNAGQWTISGVISEETQSITVDIPDNVALHHIPNGSTVTPTDDIQIWLHCANIWDKAYTTISQVLADASTLQALIASTNAVDYMARSTTWASSVTADSSAMSYIGLDNYCADSLLADSTWRNAICNSTYFESVLNVKVPTMTSNTAPSGVCFASTTYGGNYVAWKAFDKITNSYWSTTNGSITNQHLGYQFPISAKVYMFEILTASSRPPKDCKIQYSSNGSDYSDACEFTLPNTGNKTTRIYIDNTANAEYWRLFMSNSYNTDYIYITEAQFYGRIDV